MKVKVKNWYAVIVSSFIALLLGLIVVLVYLNLNTALKVQSFTISGGVESASLSNQTLNIKFTRPIKLLQDIQVQPQTPMSVNASNNSLIIKFEANLQSDTEYTVNLKDRVEDIYGAKIQEDVLIKFKTSKIGLVYLEQHTFEEGENDKVILRGIKDAKEEVLLADPQIINFSANKEYVVIQTRDVNTKRDSIYIKSLKENALVKILEMAEGQVQSLKLSSSQNKFVFLLQQSGAEPQINIYNIDLLRFVELDLKETVENVNDLGLTKDGNYYLYAGLNSNFYIGALNAPNQVKVLGKFVYYLDSDVRSKSLYFLNQVNFNTVFNIDKFNRDTGQKEDILADTTNIIDIVFANNSNSYFYSKWWGLSQSNYEKYELIMNENGNEKSLLKEENISYEYPLSSPDDQYLKVEKYVDEQLSKENFRYISLYRTKPLIGSTLVLDQKSGKIVLEIPNAVNAQFIELP